MDDDTLRGLLGRVRERLGDRLLLSRLGIALREIDPAFRLESYSALNLTDLLRRVPDVGSIVGAGSQSMFLFAGASPAPSAALRLQPSIWRAVTDFRADAGQWHMDLESFELRHSAHDPENLLQTEGERFVALPALGTDFQKRLVRDLVSERLPTRLEAVDKALSEQDWFTSVIGILETAGMVRQWKALRARRLTEEVLKWADAHGIAREHVVDTTPRPALPLRQPMAISSSNDLQDMRALVHAAVDMMSLPELAALDIPPAYLALAAHRRLR